MNYEYIMNAHHSTNKILHMMFVYKCWYVSKYASGIEGKSILDYVIHTSYTDCPVIHDDNERVRKKE